MEIFNLITEQIFIFQISEKLILTNENWIWKYRNLFLFTGIL